VLGGGGKTTSRVHPWLLIQGFEEVPCDSELLGGGAGADPILVINSLKKWELTKRMEIPDSESARRLIFGSGFSEEGFGGLVGPVQNSKFKIQDSRIKNQESLKNGFYRGPIHTGCSVGVRVRVRVRVRTCSH